MRKLKLESLNVESFDTTATPFLSRGTVLGNDQVATGFKCRTDNPEACGPTNYLDCTLACSDFASCLGGC